MADTVQNEKNSESYVNLEDVAVYLKVCLNRAASLPTNLSLLSRSTKTLTR